MARKERKPQAENAEVAQDTQVIMDSIRHIVAALRQSSTTLEKKVGVSAAQLFVLQQLREDEPLSINEIAERVRTHQTSVSAVVLKLEDLGLVKRQRGQADGRRTEVVATPRGRALLAKTPPTLQFRMFHALEKMPPKVRQGLARGLEQWVADAEMGTGAPPMFFMNKPAAKR